MLVAADIDQITSALRQLIAEMVSAEISRYQKCAKATRRSSGAAAKQAEPAQQATHSRYLRDRAEALSALSARLDAIEQGPLSREQVCALAADEVMAERQAGRRACFSKQLCDRIASEARSDPVSLSRYQKRLAVIASKNPRH